MRYPKKCPPQHNKRLLKKGKNKSRPRCKTSKICFRRTLIKMLCTVVLLVNGFLEACSENTRSNGRPMLIYIVYTKRFGRAPSPYFPEIRRPAKERSQRTRWADVPHSKHTVKVAKEEEELDYIIGIILYRNSSRTEFLVQNQKKTILQ